MVFDPSLVGAGVASEAVTANYRVTVDFSTHGDPLRPLRGVNKGVRHTQGANDVPLDYPFDYSTLYESFGISSARLHEGGFNVSNVFRAPLSAPVELISGIDRGVRDSQGDPYTSDWERWLTSLLDVGDRRGEMVYLEPHDFQAWAEDEGLEVEYSPFYLYWYPRLVRFGDDLSQLWTESNLWYEESRVQPAYQSLENSVVETYFRFGEGNYGPTFIGPPDGVNLLSQNFLDTYARAGTRFLQDLVDGSSGAPPPFVEFWNETFSASDWEPEDLAVTFADLFDAVRSRIQGEWTQDVPVGGFGFSAGAMREFVAANPDSFVRLVLEAAAPAEPDFISYHWYGVDREGLIENLPRFQRQHYMYQLADDLIDIDNRLYYLCSLSGYGNLVSHVTEWGLRLPEDRSTFASWLVPGYNHLRGMMGLSFVSAGLTWMQNPLLALRVERAHYWSGRGFGTGLFDTDLEVLGADPEAPVFFVRTPALAMLTHEVMNEHMSWVDVGIEEFVQPPDSPNAHLVSGGPFDAQAAATERMMVTALAGTRTAAGGVPDHSVILTNLSESTIAVDLEMSGIPFASSADVTVTAVKHPDQMVAGGDHPDTVHAYTSTTRGDVRSQGYPFRGTDIETALDANGDIESVSVTHNAIDAFVDTVLETSQSGSIQVVGSSGRWGQLTLPPFGILRVDVTLPVLGTGMDDDAMDMGESDPVGTGNDYDDDQNASQGSFDYDGGFGSDLGFPGVGGDPK